MVKLINKLLQKFKKTKFKTNKISKNKKKIKKYKKNKLRNQILNLQYNNYYFKAKNTLQSQHNLKHSLFKEIINNNGSNNNNKNSNRNNKNKNMRNYKSKRIMILKSMKLILKFQHLNLVSIT